MVTSTVWDAIRTIAGVVDLHRSPLQSFGERVRLERRSPVHLGSDDDGPVLEIHLVVRAGVNLVTLGEAVARAGATYLSRAAGTPISHVEVCVDDVAVVDE